MLKTLLMASLAVGASAGINAVKEVSIDAPAKFETILDPVSAGCKNPIVDSHKSGVYALDDGRFGVLVIFLCGKEDTDVSAH